MTPCRSAVLAIVLALSTPAAAQPADPFILVCSWGSHAVHRLRVDPSRLAVVGQLPTVGLVEPAEIRPGVVRRYDSNFLVADWRGQFEVHQQGAADGWLRFTVNRNTFDLTFEIFPRSGDQPPSGPAIDTTRGSCTIDRPRF